MTTEPADAAENRIPHAPNASDPADDAIDALMEALAEARATPEAFGSAYNRSRPPSGAAPRYASIRVESRNDETLAMERAARRAFDNGFFLRLYEEVTRGVPMSEVTREKLASAVSPKTLVGEHQAIFDDEALKDVAWASVVTRVAPVTALVRDREATPPARGTGFLIGPDLLLTAAHVVWPLVDYGTNPPKRRPGTAARLKIEFHDPSLADEQGRPRVVDVVEDWLVDSSAPCGTPPDLVLNDAAMAKANLDFALIRLAERIGDEAPFLDIADPPMPQDRNGMVIVGHTGGGTRKFHVHWLDSYEREYQRLRHKLNAVSGMSGGPCLTIAGRVVALHEGVARDGSRKPIYNRSVYLGPVYDRLRTAFAWQARGPLSWLAEEDGEEPLRRVFGDSPPAGRPRHPVFGRTAFQDWIDEVRGPATVRPVALISGEDGAGKSFSVAILRTKLRGGTDVLVHFPPEICRTIRTEELLSRLFACVSDRSAPPDAAGQRPGAGILRHDVVPNALDELERALRRDGERRLWITADFGRDQGWLSGSASVWTEFIAQAAQRPWMRIVVIGIAPSRQADFLTFLSASERPFTEQVGHADVLMLADFVDAQIAGQLGKDDKVEVWNRLVNEWRSRMAAIASGETTVEAVRCAIRLKNLLTQHGSVR